MFDDTKKILIIDDIKSSNIHQAIFILKDRESAIKDFNILDEANSIIYQYVSQQDRPISRHVKKKKNFFRRKKQT